MKDCIMKAGVVLLFILHLASCAGSGSGSRDTGRHGTSLPIVYSPRYNISFWGLEHFHPFDSHKYGRVYELLLQSDVGLEPGDFFRPMEVSRAELLQIHSGDYLDSLDRSDRVAEILQMPFVRWLPGGWVDAAVLRPMRYGTAGTILAARLALERGWAVNLSGGYHHAKADRGEGFCVYADVPLAVTQLWRDEPDLQVLIVDLDVHQGNGNSLILGADPRVAILDLYNREIYPQDRPAEALVSRSVTFGSGLTEDAYLEALHTVLPQVLDAFSPGLVVFNAGTDVYERDPLGRIHVSRAGIILRDQMVFTMARERGVPVLMVLSGGYHQDSAEIIAESLINLFDQGLISRS